MGASAAINLGAAKRRFPTTASTNAPSIIIIAEVSNSIFFPLPRSSDRMAG